MTVGPFSIEWKPNCNIDETGIAVNYVVHVNVGTLMNPMFGLDETINDCPITGYQIYEKDMSGNWALTGSTYSATVEADNGNLEAQLNIKTPSANKVNPGVLPEFKVMMFVDNNPRSGKLSSTKFTAEVVCGPDSVALSPKETSQIDVVL